MEKERRGNSMDEKVLNGKKNGMKALLLVLLCYILDIVVFAFSVAYVDKAVTALPVIGLAASIIVFCTAWIFFCGLKV